MNSLRYSKQPNGRWSRTTLAFMHFAQWERRNPHVEHGACGLNRRTGNKPLPPRNYAIWPVFESPYK